MPIKRWRPLLIAAVVLAALVVMLPGQLASAQGGLDSKKIGFNGVRPTIVLVHGAWADASSWKGEVLALQSQGFTVVAPPNPLRALSEDSGYLRNFLSTISGPVVLVGHSYGGAVITNAATGNPE